MEDQNLDNLLPKSEEAKTPPPPPPQAPPPPPPPQKNSGAVLPPNDYMNSQVQGRADNSGPSGLVIWLSAIILLLIGGTVLAAWQGFINLPFLFQPPKLDQVIINLHDINSARLDSKMTVALTDRQPGLAEIDLLNSEAEDAGLGTALAAGFLAQLPDDARLELNFATDLTRHTKRPALETTLSGRYQSDAATVELAGTARVINQEFYVRPDTVPGFLIGALGSPQGQWIKMTSDQEESEKTPLFKLKSDLEEGADGDNQNPLDHILAGESDLIAEAVVLFGVAVKQGAVAAYDVESTKDPLGRKAWAYHLHYDSEELRRVQHVVFAQREQLLPDAKTFMLLDEKWPSLEERYPTMSATDLQKIVESTALTLFVDRQTSQPFALTISIPLAPTKKVLPALAEKQLNIDIQLALDRINEKVVVDVPDDFVLWKDVNPILGDENSLAEQKARDQIELIGDYRRALEAYKKDNGIYPADLDVLMGLEVPSGFNFEEGDEDEWLSIVVGLPGDVFTGQPFVYDVDEHVGYRLTYQMQIPEENYLSNPEEYVNGTNTANAITKSEQGMDDTDTDEDGLADWLEEMWGTDKFNEDTDGDGYLDGQEVDGGFDPLS